MRVLPRPDAVAEGHFQRSVTKEWERFLSTGECNPALLRDLIFSSWKRCASEATSTPRRHMPMVDTERLAASQKLNAEVVSAATEVLSSMQDVLHATRSVILLTDADGVILESFGAQRYIDYAAERNLHAGGNCHEIAGGTNAIGTALAVGHAVQVHASEHFFEYVKGWTCSAALIRDPVDRDILGVLDISGTKDTFSAHNLALAVSLSRHIESFLHLKESQARNELLEWSHARSASWASDAILVLDKKGRVVFKNASLTQELSRRGVRHNVEMGARFVPNGGALSNRSTLPEWLQPDWIQPFTNDGKDSGYLIVIPLSGQSRTAFRAPALEHSNKNKAPVPPADPFVGIVGESALIRRCVDKARRLAAGDAPVLILGETGVGKEEFALAMHAASPVADGPFVAVNCGALPRELALTELFGYADGAFTGGVRGGRSGKFEHANGGTLFLDEVGDLPLEAQAQLLRVLQDGCVMRLGEFQPRRVSVRILSATNIDIHKAIAENRFRKDLFYRLASASLDLPSLQDRSDDIPLLARYFCRKLAEKYQMQEKYLDLELLEALQKHAWPGNVRELHNLIGALWQFSENQIMDLSILQACGQALAPVDNGIKLPPLQRTERDEIVHALEVQGRNLAGTARHLGIARSTLYLKIKKYGISI